MSPSLSTGKVELTVAADRARARLRGVALVLQEGRDVPNLPDESGRWKGRMPCGVLGL